MKRILLHSGTIIIGLSILLCIQVVFISYNFYYVEKKQPIDKHIKFTVKEIKHDNSFSIDCFAKGDPIFTITMKDGNLLHVTLNGHYYTRSDLGID